MIAGGRVLGLIPARGGSKGVPRKNLRELGGKPLLQWTVEVARDSRYIDRLVLSTDDDEIARLGESLGLDVPFRRPASASSDEASARNVIEHALDYLGESFDYVVYLQPTSPFRAVSDIDGCLALLAGSTADTCVSVAESPAKPEWLFFIGADSHLRPALGSPPRLRRQELQVAYELNGAVYVARVAAYRRSGTFLTERTLPWIMPGDRSIDLDEPSDFERAEDMLRAGSGPAA
jgi:N-acylneuraminate cytidylyltransferase